MCDSMCGFWGVQVVLSNDSYIIVFFKKKKYASGVLINLYIFRLLFFKYLFLIV